ncbi:hypothetical protein JRQ81_015225 [Phrynocephalus forsythii]|uniref:Uncharacterized protein n=1 Tax=Phrynocephalus forsythii TaxID=171643 RepID=A0A9Q0XU54_9SAUR|nr:hypothetical protein JRQ81_015225 [Phrynocephalus forsythii]
MEASGQLLRDKPRTGVELNVAGSELKPPVGTAKLLRGTAGEPAWREENTQIPPGSQGTARGIFYYLANISQMLKVSKSIASNDL